jgi:methyl-accepting chemotaxis protein
MEGGSLFNPGFLGVHFNWWVGQIADDSTWRDNSLPGKHESAEQIPGWGRRYKVRIVGLHDQGEKVIPSDQLPWAQVMYPITAGGGQTGSSQTPNLRQGNFVFGFFLDGQDQQVPVIMGVLGNNAQTQLATSWTKTQQVTNETPGSLATSGFAEGKDPPVGSAKPTVPDDRIGVTKPKDPVQSAECAPPPPGVAVNEFGLRADKSLNSQQFADQQSAVAEAQARGLTGTERSRFIQSKVADGIKARCQEANSPSAPSKPGATVENPDDNHIQTNADTKRNDLYLKKRIMLSPCDITSSALKAIQVLLDNLTKEIDKILQAAQSYIDAASQILSDIQRLIADFACQIAKYMKIVFDKILEFILKQINKSIAPTVDSMYPNQRYQFLDVKETITELITCIFNKITNNLCGQIQSALNNILDTKTPSPDNAAPKVDMCSVEKLTGDLVATNQNDINQGIDDILDIINKFLSDIQSQLAQVSSNLSDISASVSSITSSITSALSFENIKLNVFGCDLKPSCPVSDYYTLHKGGGAGEESQTPNYSSVAKNVQSATEIAFSPGVDFAQPAKTTVDLNFNNPTSTVSGFTVGANSNIA